MEQEKKDLGLILSDGWSDSKDVADMLDKIRERYLQMELILNCSETAMGLPVEGEETLERLTVLKNLRDSFADDAKSRTTQTKE